MVVTVSRPFITCDTQLIVLLGVNDGYHRRSFINCDTQLIVLLGVSVGCHRQSFN